MAAFCCYRANQKIKAPPWAETLLLSAEPTSRIHAFNIAAVSPFCMQAILALADFHNSPIIQVHQRLVVRTDVIVADAPHAEVFILDPADQETPKEYIDYVRNNSRDTDYPPAFLRTHVPTKEITNRVEASCNLLLLFYLAIRRVPKDASDRSDNAQQMMLGLFEQ